MKKRFSKSQRKHIRLQKARIRRDFLGVDKQKQLIGDLQKKFSKQSGEKEKKSE